MDDVLVASTALGPVLIVASATEVRRIAFSGEAPSDHQMAGPSPLLSEALAQIEAFLAGKLRAFDLPTGQSGSPFQAEVWEAIATIPYGSTTSYAGLAERLDLPASASRAVARACATNNLALIVPCHRVVGAGGDLSGYRWGTERKQALLALESHGALFTQAALL